MMGDGRNWYYERLGADGKVERLQANDYDGSITGRIVFGTSAWFDENPDERIARGWTKHITHSRDEVREMFPDYDPCSQYVVKSVRAVDAHTVEDVYHVLDKSEEMMLAEELRAAASAMPYLDGFGETEGILWV